MPSRLVVGVMLATITNGFFSAHANRLENLPDSVTCWPKFFTHVGCTKLNAGASSIEKHVKSLRALKISNAEFAYFVEEKPHVARTFNMLASWRLLVGGCWSRCTADQATERLMSSTVEC